MNKKILSVIKEVISFAILIGIVMVIKIYVFTPIKVNGNSMYPTLKNKDIMILNEIGYYLNGVSRFDIVVVSTNNERLIKRVVGLPGESVVYKDNKLYINDSQVEENFEHAKTNDFSLKEDLGYDIIPEGYYFVIGDNRLNSIDSRIIGLVSENQIKGKAKFVVYPFNKIGNVK